MPVAGGHRCLVAVVASLLAFLAGSAAQAHRASDAFLTLTVEGAAIDGRWDIALRDLEHAVGLDRDGDLAIDWGEVQAATPAIVGYGLQHLQVAADGRACPVAARDLLVTERADGPYAVLMLTAACPATVTDLTFTYTLLAEADPLHRGLLRLDWGGRTTANVFGPDNPSLHLAGMNNGGLPRVRAFVVDGVRHILSGLDHLLFLATILIGALIAREGSAWRVAHGLREPGLAILRAVTAFTVAHSLTLSLAVFGVVNLPARLTEGLVALSIVAGGLNNVRPFFAGRLTLLVFGFGLVHGLGFAAALTSLSLPRAELIWALLAFNVGIELGQLLFIAAFVPFALALRHLFGVGACLGRAASAVIALIGAWWLVERAVGITLPTP